MSDNRDDGINKGSKHLKTYSLGKNKRTVATPHPAYVEMEKHREIVYALRSGPLVIRQQGEKWLPREPKETAAAYNNRLARSVCYGAFNKTIDSLSGLPFIRPIIVENLPPELEYMRKDCDAEGSSLTNFTQSCLAEMLEVGITFIYVDLPRYEGTLTLKRQQEENIRPYLVRISPSNLFNWTTKKVGSTTVLTSVSILESVTENRANIWEQYEVPQIRLITEDEYILYRQNDKKQWVVEDRWPNELKSVVLIPVYADRTGFMQAMPPLEDLAFLNIRHYQKQSDLDTIEHYANVPILFGAGFGDKELDGAEIAPNRAIITSDPNAKLTYVEHSGAAISASQKSIKDLEERMASLGADLIIRKSVDRQTATARLIDSQESVSMLQIFINNLEEAMELALNIAGVMLGLSDLDVEINIGENLRTPKDGPNFQDLLFTYLTDNRGVSLDQAVYELKRRGILTDSFKLEEGDSLTPPADNVNINSDEEEA